MTEDTETHSAATAPDEHAKPPEDTEPSAAAAGNVRTRSRPLIWIVAVIAVLAAALGGYLLISKVPWQQIAAKISGLEQPDDSNTPSGRELDAAMGQHYFIALPISKCFDVDITRTNISSTVVASLMLGLRPRGNHEWQTRGKFENGDPEPSLKLTSFQTSILVFSDAISRARLRFAESAEVNKSRMEFYQWVLVTLGALTTIFISLKSIMTERAPLFFWVGVLAVVFSALSTACSSMISFYTPSDTFVRSDRALTQLRQLQTDLGFMVASVPDICSSAAESDESKKSLKELTTRLTEIVSISGGSQGQNSNGNASQGGGMGTSK